MLPCITSSGHLRTDMWTIIRGEARWQGPWFARFLQVEFLEKWFLKCMVAEAVCASRTFLMFLMCQSPWFGFLYFHQLHIFTNLFLALHFLFLSLFVFGKDTFVSSFMNSSNFYGSFHKSSIHFFQNLPHLETLDAAKSNPPMPPSPRRHIRSPFGEWLLIIPDHKAGYFLGRVAIGRIRIKQQ